MNCIVIKFGGEIVESEQELTNLAHSVASLHAAGEKIVLIHGGGPFATKLQDRLGIKSEFVGGRRITDYETLQVMKMSLPGVINSDILARMKKFGIPAVAVSGINVVNTVKRPPKAVTGSEGKLIDFGFVGDIKGVNTDVIDHLLKGNFIPVISPLACDQNGQILNINADTVAVQIAKQLKAKNFVLITKVGGVFQNLEDKNSKFHALTMTQAKQKISDGIIQGGMIPKLEEGFELLSEQLDSFHIVGIERPECLMNEIKKPGSEGTAILRG
jgi:acetylglutamate kinase